MKVVSDPLINVFREIDALNIRSVIATPEYGGLYIHAMDPSCTSIIKANIKADAFPEGCDVTEPVCFSIPFMLDALVKGETCDMTVGDGQIVIKYAKSKRSQRLIVPEDRPRPVPALEGLDTCVMMSDDILSIVKLSCFSEIKSENGGVSIRMTDTGLKFSIASDVESAEMDIDGTTALEDGEQSAIFGVGLLMPLLKGLPKATVITVSMKTNLPMILTVDEDTYSMDVFLAPIIMQE